MKIPPNQWEEEKVDREVKRTEEWKQRGIPQKRQGPAPDRSFDQTQRAEHHTPFVGLGVPPPHDRQHDKDAEEKQQRQWHDKELKRGNRDIDEPSRSSGGDKRSPDTQDDHSDSHASPKPTHLTVQTNAAGTNEGDLGDEESEPSGVDEAVDNEEELGCPVQSCPVWKPSAEEEGASETEENSSRDQCGEAEIKAVLKSPRLPAGGHLEISCRGICCRGQYQALASKRTCQSIVHKQASSLKPIPQGDN